MFLFRSMCAFVVVAVVAFASVANAATYYVNSQCGNDDWAGLSPACSAPDGPKATIQAALDAADSGDLILVADGTYSGPGNCELDFAGKAVTLRGEDGPDACVVDCQAAVTAVDFHTAETLATVVERIAFVNGSDDWPPLLFCQPGTSPTIRDCVLAPERGTALRIYEASPHVSDCEFTTANTAVLSMRSAALVERCHVHDNEIGVDLYGVENTSLVRDCVIEANSDHGLQFRETTEARVVNCVIRGHRRLTNGAAISCINDSIGHVVNCVITENDGPIWPVIWASSESLLQLTNCIVWDNSPEPISASNVLVRYSIVQGGYPGIGNLDADPQFAFCTDYHLLADSPAIDSGTDVLPGGLPESDAEGNPRVLDGDLDGTAQVDRGIYERDPAQATLAVSATQLEWRILAGDPPQDQTISIRNAGTGDLAWLVAVDVPWLTVTPTTGESLGEIDEVTVTADVSALPGGAYYGTLFVIDMAGESAPRHVPVALYCNLARQVPDEYATIQDAVDAAVTGDTVLVADGNYSGDGNTNVSIVKDILVRSEGGPAACIIDGMDLAGGFELGGQAVVDGFTLTGMGGYNKRVFDCGFGGPIVRNCTITGNGSTASSPLIYCYYSRVRLENCTISNNDNPGDSTVEFWRSVPRMEGCLVSQNVSGGSGGTVNCHQSDAIISNCTILGNESTGIYSGYGGGVTCKEGNPLIVNCSIIGNSAERYGAGIYCANSSPLIVNCLVAGNTGTGEYARGGGLYCEYGSDAVLVNCTMVGNSTVQLGGGLCCDHFSDVVLANSILWGNSAPEGCQIALYTSSSLTVTHCDVSGGAAGAFVLGSSSLEWLDGNFTEPPEFIDPDGLDGDPNTWGDNNYRLLPWSECVDAGSDLLLPADQGDLDGDGDTDEPVPFDRDGAPRLRGVTVDLGAFESIAGDLDGDGAVDGADLAVFIRSTAGPDVPTPPPGADPDEFMRADLTGDGDVDVADLARLQAEVGH